MRSERTPSQRGRAHVRGWSVSEPENQEKKKGKHAKEYEGEGELKVASQQRRAAKGVWEVVVLAGLP